MSGQRTFRLNKLVRDEIVPDIIRGGGEVVRVQLQTREQKRQALLAKIVEEAQEFGVSSTVSEVADLQEAVDQLVANEGFTPEEVRQKQDEKREKVGGFGRGYFIETVTLPDDNQWVPYYAADPEKYPEVGTHSTEE